MFYLILILIALAFLHFIYEGILAPSIRLKLRFELFKARDTLRHIKITEPDFVPDTVFRPLENGLNNSIRLLARTDIVTVTSVTRKIARDPKLAHQSKKLWEHLQAGMNDQTRPIYEKCEKLFFWTLLVNNGMVVLYLLPIAAVLGLCVVFGVMTSNMIRSLVAVIYMPENQVENLIHSDQVLAV